MVEFLRDLSEAQARLLLSINTFLTRYRATDLLHEPVDEDVAVAALALADTYDTAAKGLIYEHPANSVPAERLARALKPHLSEMREKATPMSDAECAAVLKRLADAVRQQAQDVRDDPRAYLSLVGRVFSERGVGSAGGTQDGEDDETGADAPRLILP